MNDNPPHEAVQRLLRLLGDRLESFVEGDELAFETLGEAIEEAQFTAEEIHAAVLVLESLTGAFVRTGHACVEGAPGKHAQRVWSQEERELVTPEAWGLLLDLRRRGSLDPGQFERVLDLLSSMMSRPVGIDAVREVAGRVALSVEPTDWIAEDDRGDHEIAH